MTTVQTCHPRKQLLFALLSLADLSLTWMLLCGSDGRVYEANPIAGWWLARHGWPGLACFKAGSVLLVLGLVFAVSRSRPQAAARVLWLGSACLAAVTGYSATLCGVALWGGADFEELQEVAELNRKILAENRRMEPFRALLKEVGEATREGRCTLPEAAERLAATEVGRDPARIHALFTLWSECPPSQGLACLVAGNALGPVNDLKTARRLFLRLDQEFRSAYGADLPKSLHPLSDGPARTPRPEEGIHGGVAFTARPRRGVLRHDACWLSVAPATIGRAVRSDAVGCPARSSRVHRTFQ
jgi:Domain of unknown function (DUF5658)